MAEQKQKLSTSDQRKITESIQKIIYTGKENILVPTFKVIPKILATYANDEPMKDWLYGLLTGTFCDFRPLKWHLTVTFANFSSIS